MERTRDGRVRLFILHVRISIININIARPALTETIGKGYDAANWAEAYDQTHDLVAKMTLEEMNNITLGVSYPDNGCVGVSGSILRLSFPGLCLHDAGNGVRLTDSINAYASGVSIGASWNASLALQRAQYMGR